MPGNEMLIADGFEEPDGEDSFSRDWPARSPLLSLIGVDGPTMPQTHTLSLHRSLIRRMLAGEDLQDSALAG